MPFLQDLSATTLGYITGNLKGARKAYALSKTFTKSKPNMATKRKRGNKTFGKPSKRAKTTNIPIKVLARVNKNAKRFGLTKNKQDISHTTNEGTRSVKFFVTLKRKVPKHDQGQWNYTQTHQSIIGDLAGRQSCSDAFCMGNVDQFRTSSGTTYTTFQNFTAIQQLNPYLTNTGSALLPATVTPLTDRFVVKNMTMKTTFASFTDIDQTGWIYYLTPRVHCTTTPATAWINANLQMGHSFAATSFPAAGVPLGVSGSTNVNFPYETPLRKSSFHKQWRILKCVKVQLSGGGHQVIHANFKINKQFKNDMVSTDVIEGSRFLPGLTIFVMPVWLAQVVLDKTAPAPFEPTFGQTSVGMVTVNEYTCASVSGNAGRLSLALAAINLPGGATTTSLQEINPDLGTADVQTLNA